MGDDPIVDLRESDVELNNAEDPIPIVAEAWPIYPVTVPERESHYCSRRR